MNSILRVASAAVSYRDDLGGPGQAWGWAASVESMGHRPTSRQYRPLTRTCALSFQPVLGVSDGRIAIRLMQNQAASQRG